MATMSLAPDSTQKALWVMGPGQGVPCDKGDCCRSEDRVKQGLLWPHPSCRPAARPHAESSCRGAVSWRAGGHHGYPGSEGHGVEKNPRPVLGEPVCHPRPARLAPILSALRLCMAGQPDLRDARPCCHGLGQREEAQTPRVGRTASRPGLRCPEQSQR